MKIAQDIKVRLWLSNSKYYRTHGSGANREGDDEKKKLRHSVGSIRQQDLMPVLLSADNVATAAVQYSATVAKGAEAGQAESETIGPVGTFTLSRRFLETPKAPRV